MRRSVVAWLVATITAAALAVVAIPGAGATPAYAADQPGPALSVPAATLKAALSVLGDFTHTSVEPVLLNPATAVTAGKLFLELRASVHRAIMMMPSAD